MYSEWWYIIIEHFPTGCLSICRFIVHRQLSACSFYVNDDLVVQLGDFTRARAVVDDEFIAERDERVWVKWAAPEVLRHQRYTTKTDVWALAVVFWEVLVDGELLIFFIIKFYI